MLGLVAVLAVAAATRLVGLGSQPLWMDEVASLRNVQALRAGGLAGVARLDHVAPLSHALEAVSTAVGGTSEFWLRLPSALAGIAAVWLVYLVAGRLGAPPRVGLATAAVAALSPFAVWYSQEARMYSLLLAVSLGYVYVCWPLVRGEATRRHVIGSALLCAVGLWTHHYMALLVASFGLLLFWRVGRRDRGFRAWLLAQVVAAASFVPWLVLSAGPGEGTGFEKSGLVAWLPYTIFTFFAGQSLGPSVRDLREQPLGTALAGNAPALVLVAVCIVVVLMLGGRFWLRRDRVVASWLVCWGLGPVVLAILLTIPTGLSYNVRYAIPALPAWFLLAGGAMVGASRQWIPRLTAALLVVIEVASLAGWYADPHYAKDDTRSAAVALQARQPGDRVVLDGVNARWGLGYYGWTCADSDVGLWHGAGVPGALSAITRRDRPGRTWLVVFRPWEADAQGVLERAFTAPGDARLVGSWPGVRLWEAPGTGDAVAGPGLSIGCVG